jgi:TonB family protein
MILIDTELDSTRTSETVCMAMAVGLHALALFWNPVLIQSHYKPIHDFVTVDVVDQTLPNAAEERPTPKKMSLMDTLKDMLMKPKAEEIAHVAPEPQVPRVAAPVQPALKDRSIAHSIATMFQPKSQEEDLATASAPNSIKTQTKNFAMPTAAPALQSKSFGGIRAKDLPFQVGTDQELAGGNATVIPVAVGNRSAKAALGYSNPVLTDAGKHAGVLSQKLGGPVGDISALGAGAPSTIQLSGTGGTGNAPTGAAHGSALQDRSGSGSGGGLVSRAMFGSGGRGGGSLGGIGGIPDEAAELDKQLAATASAASNALRPKKSFEIAGPLNNRSITHKVIPQYPAWAEEQGIIGSVRIWFTVTSDGAVRSNMRVTKTTGYPDLDKLALEALKQWTFASFESADESNQWGIITFTFSLSS